MQAEIIAIGDELVCGARLDTNSQWLSRALGEIGVRTAYHTTVGDDLDANIRVLRTAASRADIVVCTGGLGPTKDDLTREAMAAAFNLELVLDEDSLRHIEQLFASRKREMPARNRAQAMFPDGAIAIANPHGSAPGVDLATDVDGQCCRFFALPGVPAEMKQMWNETVAQRIDSAFERSGGQLRHHTLKIFGIGESDVEEKLPELINRDRFPTVGITVSQATISLRIAGRAKTDEEFEQQIQPTLREIETALGDLIFGSGSDELQDAVVRLLQENSQTLATVEVGAASLAGDWLLRAANSAPGHYLGGVSFPSLNDAQNWCGDGSLPEASETRPQSEASSTDTAWRALAQQALKRFRADIVLVIGPYPAKVVMEKATAPFPIYWAVADGQGQSLKLRSLGGHPDVLPARIAKAGLDIVRRKLNYGR